MAARIAEFYCSELGTTLIVYSDGEIWEEHGSKEIAKIYKDGQIWAYGKHIANYDSSNGQLWDSTNSTKICTIYSDGDVYDELGRLGKVYSNNDDSDDYRRSSSNSCNDDNDYNDYGRSSYNYNESSRYDSGSSSGSDSSGYTSNSYTPYPYRGGYTGPSEPMDPEEIRNVIVGIIVIVAIIFGIAYFKDQSRLKDEATTKVERVISSGTMMTYSNDFNHKGFTTELLSLQGYYNYYMDRLQSETIQANIEYYQEKMSVISTDSSGNEIYIISDMGYVDRSTQQLIMGTSSSSIVAYPLVEIVTSKTPDHNITKTTFKIDESASTLCLSTKPFNKSGMSAYEVDLSSVSPGAYLFKHPSTNESFFIRIA